MTYMIRRPHDKYFDKGLRNWINKTARENYWRIAPWYGLDGLIGDGNLAFVICKRRYAHKVRNKAHFMALVKTVFWNMIMDLATDNIRAGEIPVSQLAIPGMEETFLEAIAGVEESDAELYATLRSAPDEVRQLLALFQEPDKLAALRKDVRKENGARETTQETLCRLLGLPLDYPIEAKVRAAIT